MNVVSQDVLAVPDSHSPYSDATFLAGFGFLPLFEESPGAMKASGGSMSLEGESDSSRLLGADFDLMADVSYLGLDQDWMAQPQPIPLLTPDEQTGSPSAVYPPLQCSYTPSPPGFPGLPTPDSSLPSSPQSSYYSEDPEFNEVMCSFLDEEEVSQFSPNELGTPATPFQYSHFEQCDCELLNAPLGDGLGSTESIRDLLVKTEASPASPCAQQTPELSSKQLVFSNERPRFKRRLSQSARKERKREQNKTAALRYRQRKKGEKQTCSQKVQVLEIKNSELKDKVKALSSEIDYLKKLWLEVREAKKRKRTG